MIIGKLHYIIRNFKLRLAPVYYLVIISVFLFSCSDSPKAPSLNKILTVKEMQKDLKRLKHFALEEHPALLPELAKNNFEDTYNKSISLIIQDMEIIDFYIIARKLVGIINCGHTKLHLPDGFWEKLTDSVRHFPFKIYYSDDKIYIEENYSDNNLLIRGTEILSINDKTSSTLVKDLLQLITSDGQNSSYKYSQINNITYGLFPAYSEFPDSYKVEYKPNKSTDTFIVTVQSKSKPVILKKQSLPKRAKAFNFTTIDSLKTAIINIKEFIYFPVSEYMEFIKSSFESINHDNINNLILDFRANDGGDPANAAEILSYITNTKPIYFQQWVPGYPKLKRPLQPKFPQFKGDIYVLTDGESFSTTGHLISLIKYHKLGIIVGEETGGSYYCYGCQSDIKLPNSKFIFSYGSCTYQTKVSGFSNSTGIIPDIKIKPTIEDIISGYDPVLNFVLELLNN